MIVYIEWLYQLTEFAECFFSNAKKPSCFYPIPQASDCISRVVERANTPVIYLSTDAAESEIGLLQSGVVWDGKTVPLVQRPTRNSAEKWDALLYRHGLEGDAQVNLYILLGSPVLIECQLLLCITANIPYLDVSLIHFISKVKELFSMRNH